MKVFSAIPHDGAVEVQTIARGAVFTPRGAPKRLFLSVIPFDPNGLRFRVFESNGVSVRLHQDPTTLRVSYCVGADLETGELVLFHPDTRVIPVPSHVITGRAEP